MKGYQLRVTVQGNQSILRLINVPVELTFSDLHFVIQDIFGLFDNYLFHFKLDEIDRVVLDSNSEKFIYNDKVILENEKIKNYLYENMVFEYLCDSKNNNFKFQITVEKELDDVLTTPEVIDYCGNNLTDERDDMADQKFNLAIVNECLQEFRLDEFINDTELKERFIDELNKLKEIIEKRNITSYQVINLNDIYVVIVKTFEGYIIQIFENYDDLISGFYNLGSESINHAFSRCFTFLLSNEAIELNETLDFEHKIAAFFDEPGYLPSLINVEDGLVILQWLEQLTIGLSGDNNTSEDDEIIEITVKNNQYENSLIYIREPKIDLNNYYDGYRGEESLKTSLNLIDQASVDIVCIPTIDSVQTNELQVYAVIATRDDYLLKEVLFPDNILMSRTLIDVMIDFFNRNGKPNKVIVNNLNILFMIYEFLMQHDIGYIEDDNSLEIDLAIADALGLDNDIISDPILQDLLTELEGKSEEEIRIKLEEVLTKKELLN